MKKAVYTTDSQELILDIPAPSDFSSFFVFAMHKSGSVMQDKIFEDICAYFKIPTISIAKTAFQQGIEEGAFNKNICDIFQKTGYCYYGFRYLPPYLKYFDLSDFKKVLLIRDPRDILVSHYFSIKKSHTVPQGKVGVKLLKLREELAQMEIDDYVLNKAQGFKKIMFDYSLLEGLNFKLFRYEDIIFQKQQWVQDILNFLGLNIPEEKVKNIAQKHDIFPTGENPDSHIRKVTPGDYKNKLKPETIAKLNECFYVILEKYSYELT
ncbi:MAG: sulfotransferase domain-containing protein [Cyanobacteriota bacterium]|nr:sulfotransferase domain-containing protein [Cyanobacteriota bacterium]